MTGDEKRREVAERLRQMADARYAVEASRVARVLGLEYEAYGTVVAFNSAAVQALADLIDLTCHIVLKPSDSDFNDEPHYLCSRCGKAGIDVYERDDYTLAGIVDHARCCSDCGARVVSGT